MANPLTLPRKESRYKRGNPSSSIQVDQRSSLTPSFWLSNSVVDGSIVTDTSASTINEGHFGEGLRSTQVGMEARARADGSVVFGNGAEALGDGSIVVGLYAKGKENTDRSVIIGLRSVVVNAPESVLVGSNIDNKGGHHAVGVGHAVRVGPAGVALGCRSAAGPSSIAIGTNAKAEPQEAIAIKGTAAAADCVQIGRGTNNEPGSAQILEALTMSPGSIRCRVGLVEELSALHCIQTDEQVFELSIDGVRPGRFLILKGSHFRVPSASLFRHQPGDPVRTWRVCFDAQESCQISFADTEEVDVVSGLGYIQLVLTTAGLRGYVF